MSEAETIHLASQAMLLILYLSLPAVITATVLGLIVGLFQALTQIQEQTLAFGVKLVGVLIVMMLTVDWIGNELLNYTVRLMNQFWKI